MNGVADAIFSTATFHWVLDHDALFSSLLQALKPGGRLVAQCGGGPNIQRLHDRAATLMHTPEFATYFEQWRDPWEFADADVTRRRLRGCRFRFDSSRASNRPRSFMPTRRRSAPI